jgi:tetratricopeptide (TPR) repeat protein
MNRGEHALAEPHREQVELHAAHVGSAWQVEAWEAPALIPISAAISDVVSLTQITERLDAYARKLPSLRLHARLAKFALELARRNPREHAIPPAVAELDALPPRSFIGWTAACGFVARAFNEVGRYEKAIAMCERAFAQMTDGDRDFVTLFLIVDLEMAMALTGLGRYDEAFARIDALLARFAGSDHPLLVGRLHEARAVVAWHAGQRVEYARSQQLMEQVLRPTGTPALIARCERLAELAHPTSEHRPSLTEGQRNATTLHEVPRNA